MNAQVEKNAVYLGCIESAGFSGRCPVCEKHGPWLYANTLEKPDGTSELITPLLTAMDNSGGNVGLDLFAVMCKSCGYIMSFSKAHLDELVAKDGND